MTVKEVVYEVRFRGDIIVAFSNLDDAIKRANMLNCIYERENHCENEYYYVVKVEKDAI